MAHFTRTAVEALPDGHEQLDLTVICSVTDTGIQHCVLNFTLFRTAAAAVAADGAADAHRGRAAAGWARGAGPGVQQHGLYRRHPLVARGGDLGRAHASRPCALSVQHVSVPHPNRN